MIILGLSGYPLEHSFSPRIHKAALDVCGLQGSYSLFPIPAGNLKGLKDLLNRVRCSEITGLNVTIPHKQTIIPLLDKLTPTAEAIGAVNTIYMHNGKLIGDNTDAAGFSADLHNFFNMATGEHDKDHLKEYLVPNSKHNEASDRAAKHALVLGAGGSASAVTYALLNIGWKVTLTARRPEQAQRLITQFKNHSPRISFIKYQTDAFRRTLSSLHLIINTTPVGMSPNIDISPWLKGVPFPQGAFLYDLIYNPRDTKLTLDARAAGLRATTGLGMLLEQAALAFNLWTDHAVSSDQLLRALAAADFPLRRKE